ncbi:hypothetical protein C5167_016519 [Papaver somniferum]|nr:hypothetical protein C5167_016519 [Papaver somniferum]
MLNLFKLASMGDQHCTSGIGYSGLSNGLLYEIEITDEKSPSDKDGIRTYSMYQGLYHSYLAAEWVGEDLKIGLTGNMGSPYESLKQRNQVYMETLCEMSASIIVRTH